MASVDVPWLMIEKALAGVSRENIVDALNNLGLDPDDAGDHLVIDVTAERSDLLSPQGMLIALRSYLGTQKGLRTITMNPSGVNVIVKPSVEGVRPKTVAAVVRGLALTEDDIKSIMSMQEKLHTTMCRNRKKAAIGVYPLEHISLPITYEARKPEDIRFVPLESSRLMNGREIIDVHPKGKEFAHLLSDKKTFPIFVDASGDIMSMPPIINSAKTGRVTTKTTDVFIECSGFDEHFMNGVLAIVVHAFAEMGGTIETVDVMYGNNSHATPNLRTTKMQLSVDETNNHLGTSLRAKEVTSCLERMGHGVVTKSKDVLEVESPAYRTDLWHPVDLMDDVLRAYGVNNLEPVWPDVPTIGGRVKSTIISDAARDALVGLGYQEVFTLGLTSTADQFAKMNAEEKQHIPLGVAAEKTINMVRCWLLPEVIKALVENRSRQFPQNVFEVNYVVEPDKDTDVKSRNVLKIALASSHATATLLDARKAVESLASQLGIPVVLKAHDHPSCIPGRCLSILADVNGRKKTIGFVGELHPTVITNWGLEQPTSVAELNLSEMCGL